MDLELKKGIKYIRAHAHKQAKLQHLQMFFKTHQVPNFQTVSIGKRLADRLRVLWMTWTQKLTNSTVVKKIET